MCISRKDSTYKQYHTVSVFLCLTSRTHAVTHGEVSSLSIFTERQFSPRHGDGEQCCSERESVGNHVDTLIRFLCVCTRK